MKLIKFLPILILNCIFATLLFADTIPNSKIDAEGFLSDVQKAHALRVQRRITEDEFVSMAKDSSTVVLDARSANKFAQMHIAGAKNLPFTDFTVEALKSTIPSQDVRILIYCNNNIANSPVAFADKAIRASLNLSTYPALYTYGYKNVFELGPVIDPAISKIKFEGSLVSSAK